MFKNIKVLLIALLTMLLLTGCGILDELFEESDHTLDNESPVSEIMISELENIDHFRSGSLEHILEGELNGKGQAVGFHYDGLSTKKGEVISGTETEPNEHGIYEAKVKVSDVPKTSNGGKSTFFPKEWNTQEVVDVINEAYDTKEFITGNTYEGLTKDGQVIRMYLDQNDLIISAFPVY